MRREWRSYLNERSGRCMRCSWEQIQDAARGEGKGTPAGEGSRGCLKFEGWSGVTIRRNQLTVSREVPRLLNSRLPPPPFLSSFPPPPFPFPPSFSLHPLPPCHTLNTPPLIPYPHPQAILCCPHLDFESLCAHGRWVPMCRLPYLVGLRRYREARSDSGFLGKNRERKEKKREKGKTLIRLFISLSYEQKRKHCYVRTRVKYSFLLSQFCFFCYLILILFFCFLCFSSLSC